MIRDSTTPREDIMAFVDSSIAQHLASPLGRVIRASAGLALIAWSVQRGGTLGVVGAIVGLVPLAAGALDFCLLGPLFHAPFWGHDIRAHRAA
jgi:hypothetical protein